MKTDESRTPWISIWLNPRSTITDILEKRPLYCFWLLAGVYGFSLILQAAQALSLGATISSWAILFFSLLFSGVVGFVFFSIVSRIIHWTGSWIGGKGSYNDIKIATAWSNVPNVVNGVIWIAMTVLFGSNLYLQEFMGTPFSGGERVVVQIAAFIQTVILVWGVVLWAIMIGVVQKFSAWKALLNLLISFFVVFLSFYFIVFIFNFLNFI